MCDVSCVMRWHVYSGFCFVASLFSFVLAVKIDWPMILKSCTLHFALCILHLTHFAFDASRPSSNQISAERGNRVLSHCFFVAGVQNVLAALLPKSLSKFGIVEQLFQARNKPRQVVMLE